MRPDKLALGLMGIVMLIGAVALLQQRETNAELHRQIEELYRKVGHEPGPVAGAADPRGGIAVSKEGVSQRPR